MIARIGDDNVVATACSYDLEPIVHAWVELFHYPLPNYNYLFALIVFRSSYPISYLYSK